MTTPKISVYSLSGPHPPYLIMSMQPLTLYRSKKHYRRRPAQLPYLAQIYAITLLRRRQAWARLFGSHHRSSDLPCRLQAGMGRDKGCHAVGCDCVLCNQWGSDSVDLARGEGEGVCGREGEELGASILPSARRAWWDQSRADKT